MTQALVDDRQVGAGKTCIASTLIGSDAGQPSLWGRREASTLVLAPDHLLAQWRR
jgi:N12 class adenine-specific DNA methylase